MQYKLQLFVNKNIIRIYSFCAFLPGNTRQMHFEKSIVTKKQSSPPLKYPTIWGGGVVGMVKTFNSHMALGIVYQVFM